MRNTFFSTGNFDIWDYYINEKMPEGMRILKTIVMPVIEKGLSDLLGDSSEFERLEGNIDFIWNPDGTPGSLEGFLSYEVSSFKIPDDIIPREAQGHDEAFLNSYTTRIEKVKFKPVSINLDNGIVAFKFYLNLGDLQ